MAKIDLADVGPGVAWVFEFDENGRGRLLSDKLSIDLLHGRRFVWVHLILANARTRDWVVSYLDLFALRDAVLPGKPVIGHCYDYAMPNGVPALCAGPWLQPSLEFSGYDLAEGLAIVSSMIDGFYAMVSALAGDAGNNFVLVDSRGTLKRASGASDGWANELHPYPAGFSRLAQRFLPALQGFPAASVSAPAPRRRSSK
jgi:hypothetical protein